MATTNNPHPLTDATGSRRYICLEIPKGMFIDNAGEIDYKQLYAQVLYELREQEAPYWFNNDEVARKLEPFVRTNLFASHCKTYYYEFRNGTRLIHPAIQEEIRALFRQAGWNHEVHFDSYVEDYDW